MGCDVTIRVRGGRHRRRPRLVPRVGPITEQTGPAVPTPQHQGRPEGELLMALTMTDSQQAPLSLTFKDKKSNPTSQPPAGTPSWSTDNTDVLALTPASDNLSCVCAAAGPLGTGTVTFKISDAAGSTVEAGTLDVTITAGAAATVEVTAGTPTEQS